MVRFGHRTFRQSFQRASVRPPLQALGKVSCHTPRTRYVSLHPYSESSNHGTPNYVQGRWSAAPDYFIKALHQSIARKLFVKFLFLTTNTRFAEEVQETQQNKEEKMKVIRISATRAPSPMGAPPPPAGPLSPVCFLAAGVFLGGSLCT